MMAYNGMDKITVDVPLMLRLMEYAREDALHDKDLFKEVSTRYRYIEQEK